jgi:hypothetical protein
MVMVFKTRREMITMIVVAVVVGLMKIKTKW